jgi:hypothetical protein
MASSSEAFKKFSQWNKLKTSLKVTEIERGKPERAFSGVRVDALDDEVSQVGVVQPSTRGFTVFDVEGAEFSIESGRLVASRADVEWLIFEEEL